MPDQPTSFQIIIPGENITYLWSVIAARMSSTGRPLRECFEEVLMEFTEIYKATRSEGYRFEPAEEGEETWICTNDSHTGGIQVRRDIPLSAEARAASGW